MQLDSARFIRASRCIAMRGKSATWKRCCTASLTRSGPLLQTCFNPGICMRPALLLTWIGPYEFARSCLLWNLFESGCRADCPMCRSRGRSHDRVSACGPPPQKAQAPGAASTRRGHGRNSLLGFGGMDGCRDAGWTAKGSMRLSALRHAFRRVFTLAHERKLRTQCTFRDRQNTDLVTY